MSSKGFQVTVLGAAGGIGQPLSLLLKLNRTGLIRTLNLYDLAPITNGVAVDLSHIPTSPKVTGFVGSENLSNALRNSDVVIVPAGVPRKPGMTRDDLFNINAGINVELATACAKECPNAMYLVVSNPVNSIIPVWAETLKKLKTYNPNKLFGVTTLDISRANTFATERAGTPVNVPVVGGHAGNTIVPLFSLAQPPIQLEGEELEKFTHRVAFGGDEVVQAKAGSGSATLSMAAAGAKFCESVLSALNGQQVEEIAYVLNASAEKKYGTPFFATEIVIGTDGIVDVKDTISNGNDFEKARVDSMIGDLHNQIKKGIDFVASKL